MTIGLKLLKMAAESRETLARSEFNREIILSACEEAAGKGATSCEIRPSLPVSVERTLAFDKVSRELRKQNLTFTWEVRQERTRWPFLVVSWERTLA